MYSYTTFTRGALSRGVARRGVRGVKRDFFFVLCRRLGASTIVSRIII